MGKAALVIITFLAYSIFAEYIYFCPISDQAFCPGEKTEQVVKDEIPQPVEVEENLSPIMFNWGDPMTVKTKYFTQEFRVNLLNGNTVDSVLEITGFYNPNEVNDTEFPNLGEARANQIANLFPEIPKDRIVLLTRRVNSPESDPDKLLEYSEMVWVARRDENQAEETTRVVKLSDRELIYFPYNSAERIENPELEEYLRNLASQLKDSGETVTLTGHTDDKGENAYNEALARKRANDVRTLLLAEGVSADKIVVQSMGETEPIASNETEQGRARNRRVEVLRSN